MGFLPQSRSGAGSQRSQRHIDGFLGALCGLWGKKEEGVLSAVKRRISNVELRMWNCLGHFAFRIPKFAIE